MARTTPNQARRGGVDVAVGAYEPLRNGPHSLHDARPADLAPPGDVTASGSHEVRSGPGPNSPRAQQAPRKPRHPAWRERCDSAPQVLDATNCMLHAACKRSVGTSSKQEGEQRDKGHLKAAAVATAVAIVLTAAGSASASTTSRVAAASNHSTLVVAGVIAITGASDFEGQNQAGGMNPAVYAIDHAGGVLGHELVYKGVDTRGDPADALPAVQQLLATTSNLVMVAGPDTGSAPTLVPVLNRAKITMTAVAGESTYDRSSFRLHPPFFAGCRQRHRHGPVGAAQRVHAGGGRVRYGPRVPGRPSWCRPEPEGAAHQVGRQHRPDARPTLVPVPGPRPSIAGPSPGHHDRVRRNHRRDLFRRAQGARGAVPIIGTEATFTAPWLTAVKGALGSSFKKTFTSLISAPRRRLRRR